MSHFLQNIKNNIDFFLRNRIIFSRKNYSEKNEDKNNILDSNEAIEREKYLIKTYDLEYLKSHSTIQNYLENLYLLDILDKKLNIKTKNSLKIIDIGCKNWFYAKGEYAFFEKYCKKLELEGIELDSNRLYTNFYSRKEVAKFYMQGLDNINYIEGNFLGVNGVNAKYDYIVWILPFVVQNPLIKWGLPLKYFQPEKMLKRAYDLLKPDGYIFILNQGDVEYEIQKDLCKKLNLSYTPVGEVKSEFMHYNIEKYLVLVNK